MHYQTIKAFIHSDLTTQAAIFSRLVDQPEFLFFSSFSATGFTNPVLIDITMTGGTGHSTATFGKNTFEHISDGTVHHSKANGNIDQGLYFIGIDVFN